MEVLRVPSGTIEYKKTGLSSGDYDYSIEDLADQSTTSGTVSADGLGVITIALPDKMDGDYEISVDGDTERVYVVRPYVDPNSLASTASEIEEFRALEMVARSIIDTQVVVGFYNKKTILQGTGQGHDYFPLWEKTNRVLKVYENDVLVYDVDAEDPTTNIYTYKITLDNSAIYRIDPSDLAGDVINRIDYRPITLPAASGDLSSMGHRTVAFPTGYDYIFVLDSGYKEVPSDIASATKMLIEDLKCGKMEYYKRYMTSYNTDQFRINFDKQMLDGTGNFIVDKILCKYETKITKPGVL